jgi:hypothetical protein
MGLRLIDTPPSFQHVRIVYMPRMLYPKYGRRDGYVPCQIKRELAIAIDQTRFLVMRRLLSEKKMPESPDINVVDIETDQLAESETRVAECCDHGVVANSIPGARPVAFHQ